MKCKILHESKGRIRVHFCQNHMTLHQADIAEYALSTISGITKVQVFDRTCDVILYYHCERKIVLSALAHFCYDNAAEALVPAQTGRALNREYEEKLENAIIRRIFHKFILPLPLRRIFSVIKALKYILKGLKSLMRGKLEVEVLDAVAITVSMLRGDFNTAGSVMFLLKIGDILAEWTHKKSVDDLARTMSLGVEQVWLQTSEGQEILVPVSQIRKDDLVIVRTGSMIPLDGKVISGDAMVNQASMTGESVPVHKSAGAYVYAGTVVEDGECTVQVEKTSGSGRYNLVLVSLLYDATVFFFTLDVVVDPNHSLGIHVGYKFIDLCF